MVTAFGLSKGGFSAAFSTSKILSNNALAQNVQAMRWNERPLVLNFPKNFSKNQLLTLVFAALAAAEKINRKVQYQRSLIPSHRLNVLC